MQTIVLPSACGGSRSSSRSALGGTNPSARRSRRVCLRAFVLAVWLLGNPPLNAQEAPVKHALLIGVNRYASEIENVPRLEFARADASVLKQELLSRGWDARAILDDEATRRRIVSELVRLAKAANPQDTVLIYFAGHGLRDKTGRQHTYWLTYQSTLPSLAVDALRLTHLMEYIGDIQANRRIVILDHCHSGDVEQIGIDTGAEVAEGGDEGDGSRGPGGGLAVTRNLFPKESFVNTVTSADPSGVVVLGSARDDAYEFQDLGHGMFTHGLLTALRDPEADSNDDGRLSIQELWLHARDEMQRVAGLKQVTQVPIEITQGHNISEWTDLFDAALETGQQFAQEADSLNDFLSQLDLEVTVDPIIRAHCVSAVGAWLTAVQSSPPQAPDSTDLDIVNELKTLRQLAVPSATKKTMLESKVRLLKGL